MLLLCTETHVVDYVTHDMFLLLSQFVEICYVLRVHSDSNDLVQFFDALDFVHSECFVNENLEPGIERPYVWCSSKWSQLFNPAHVHQRGI